MSQYLSKTIFLHFHHNRRKLTLRGRSRSRSVIHGYDCISILWPDAEQLGGGYPQNELLVLLLGVQRLRDEARAAPDC